jgi:thymidylate kinase
MSRLLAEMLCPARGDSESLSSDADDYAALVGACRANKVPLLSLSSGASAHEGFYTSAAFREARKEEEQRLAHQRREYERVHQALERVGISDVLIKSVGLPPSFPYMSDNVDTLVALRDSPRAKAVLFDLGYVELKNGEEPHKFLFRTFHGGTTQSIIHLHEFVGWGAGFLDGEGVLARSRPSQDDPLVTIPSPEDGVLITMAHAFYEDKEVKLGDLWQVIYALRQHDLDWDAMYRRAGHRGWEGGLHTCILLWSALERYLYGEDSFPSQVVERAREQVPDYANRYLEHRLAQAIRFPFGISFLFSKRHYYQKVSADQVSTFWEKLQISARHTWMGIELRLPFKIQRPMLVTLSGIDGAGKTAQAELLLKAFGECDLDARRVWSRGGSSRLTDAVIGLVRPFLPKKDLDTQSETRDAKTKRKGVWLQNPLLRFGWLSLVVFDLLVSYWARVLPHLLQGRVVVGDRYTYDALVELVTLTGRRSLLFSAAARLLMTLSPRPQLAYFLDVPVDEASARKPEELPSLLVRQSVLFRDMASAWSLRVVDAGADLDEVSDQLVRETLRAYYRLWDQPIRGFSPKSGPWKET